VIAFGIGAGAARPARVLRQHLSWTTIGIITALRWWWRRITPGAPSLRARLCFSGFYFAILNWLCAAAIARRSWRVSGIAVAGFVLAGRGVVFARHAWCCMQIRPTMPVRW
jgi:hypothetical protein